MLKRSAHGLREGEAMSDKLEQLGGINTLPEGRAKKLCKNAVHWKPASRRSDAKKIGLFQDEVKSLRELLQHSINSGHGYRPNTCTTCGHIESECKKLEPK